MQNTNPVENEVTEKQAARAVKTVISKHQGTVLADDEPDTELSEDQKKEAKKMFEDHDVDGNQRLDSEEILKVLEKLNLRLDEDLYEKYVKGIWDEFDQDDSGKIDAEEFLRLYSKVIAPATQYGERLRLACGRGELGLVWEYLRRGCPPYTGNGEGQTPLHIAVEMGQLQVVNALFEFVDLTMEEEVEDEATLTSKVSKSPSKAPTEDEESQISLNHAVFLDINCMDKSGWTPLHNAAAGGNTAIMRALIERDANVHVQNVVGRTPLHYAAEKGRDHAIKTLLANGAEINVQDMSGWSPLILAGVHGHFKTMCLLASKGASLSTKDELGRTLEQYVDERTYQKLLEDLGGNQSQRGPPGSRRATSAQRVSSSAVKDRRSISRNTTNNRGKK